MTRRGFIGSAIAAAAGGGAAPPRTTLGVTADCYQFGRRHQPAYEFAQYCHSLGAGGIQIEVPPDLDYARNLRGYLETNGMFLDVMVSLPKPDDSTAFERHVAAAKEAGAVCLRAACLGGRRYEVFHSLDQWRDFVRQSHAAIETALPIVEKHRIPLGLENHKDWTAEELCAMLRQYSSDYLGVCLDTGNNLSLLDDYLDTVGRLAPYTLNTHLKDMSVSEYPEGILLIEPVLGRGYFDLRRVVAMIRQARPHARFTLEMITRDPLRVPVFTDNYWASFPDRSGLCLARAITSARAHPWRGQLPEVQRLDREAHLLLEEENVRKCLTFAREELGMQGSILP